jgi:hypothetical protein
LFARLLPCFLLIPISSSKVSAAAKHLDSASFLCALLICRSCWRLYAEVLLLFNLTYEQAPGKSYGLSPLLWPLHALEFGASTDCATLREASPLLAPIEQQAR